MTPFSTRRPVWRMHCLGLVRQRRAKATGIRVGMSGGQPLGATALPATVSPACNPRAGLSNTPASARMLHGKGLSTFCWSGHTAWRGWEKPTGTTRGTSQAGCSKLKDTGAALALSPGEQTQSHPRMGLPRSHQPVLNTTGGGHRPEEQPAPKRKPATSLPAQGRQGYSGIEHGMLPAATGPSLSPCWSSL